jgi:hypothetical protein
VTDLTAVIRTIMERHDIFCPPIPDLATHFPPLESYPVERSRTGARRDIVAEADHHHRTKGCSRAPDADKQQTQCIHWATKSLAHGTDLMFKVSAQK